MIKSALNNLNRYNQKRDFKKTAEPEGKVAQSQGKLIYIIQKHAATRLHYDFRLEWRGTLKSWAVTRGPSLDPAEKRLAVEVEDHPVSYASFEGTIPKGQYGGGTVMLWDRGSWEPLDKNVDEAVKRGRLAFKLHGERLRGRWNLVRMNGKAAGNRKQNWLLIKGDDEEAQAREDILETYTTSVKTGRSMEEIAQGKILIHSSLRGAVRRRGNPEGVNSGLLRPFEPRNDGAAHNFVRQKNISKSPPTFVKPQLATLVDHPPQGAEWVHEIKFDGYRALVRIESGQAQILTRAGNDWTQKFSEIAHAFEQLDLKNAIIDGEIVRPNEKDVTSFHALQQALSEQNQSELEYYAFDLLYLNGENLTALPLLERKEKLRAILPAKHPKIHYSEHFSESGEKVLSNACNLKLEGIVSKRSNASYFCGRSTSWLKSKCLNEQEFVIGGFTYQPKHPDRLAALLIGYYQNNKLKFAGKVGTGFSAQESTELLAKLENLKTSQNPFGAVPASYRRNAIFVKPKLLAQIFFTEWTEAGMLRHPAYSGLREDKEAKQVTQEKPVSPNLASTIALTHPGKIMYKKVGVTKQDLADYYQKVAPLMFPHIKNYPLSLVRCPNGEGSKCFFQRHIDAVTKFLKPIKIAGSDFIKLDQIEGITELVQLGVLEIHAWGAKDATADKPDRIVFDFDPDESVKFEKVKTAALEMRERLQKLGMESFIKITGGKGLHVVLPFETGPSWDEVRMFSESMARLMAEDGPKLYTVNNRKDARVGKIFIDYLRNAKAASAIAPYSTRAKPNASIAVPIDWKDLKKLKKPNFYTVLNIPKDLNPWPDFSKIKQKLRVK